MYDQTLMKPFALWQSTTGDFVAVDALGLGDINLNSGAFAGCEVYNTLADVLVALSDITAAAAEAAKNTPADGPTAKAA